MRTEYNLFLIPVNVRRGVIYALIAMAETAWLTPLLASRITEDPSNLSAWFLRLLFLVGLALLLGWLTDEYQMPIETTRVVGIGLAILGMVLLLHVAFHPQVPFLQLRWISATIRELVVEPSQLMTLVWIVISVGYIWWRCLYVGHTPPGPSIVWFTVQIGFFGYLTILTISTFRPEAAPSLLLLMIFICCALLAMTLSYTQPIEAYHGAAAVGPFGMRTLNGIVAVAFVIVTAIVLGSIFSFPVLQRIFDIILGLIGLALKPLIALFILLADLLAEVLERLIDFLAAVAQDSELFQPTPIAQPTPEMEELVEMNAGPAWWVKYLSWLVWAGVVVVVIYIFYQFTSSLRQRYRKARIATGVIVNEPIPAEMPRLKEMLSEGFKKLGDFIDLASRFGVGSDLKAAATIKRIYAAMTVLTTQHGVERSVSQTPLEFLMPLKATWPELGEHFDVITWAYVNVHYGQLPEGKAGLLAVQEAWETIYQTISQNAVGVHHGESTPR